MKKIMILFVLLTLSSCVYLNCVPASGNVISETREIGPFDSIKVIGSADVFFSQGEASPLNIEGDDNVVAEVDTYLVGNTLVIESKECFTNHQPVKVSVSMKDIKSLQISGSSNMESVNEINSDVVEIIISGSGNVKLKGNVSKFITRISGSGKIHTYDLITKTSDISISGSGKVELNVIEELSVNIAGSGTVFYKGTPKVSQSVSGSGKIESVEWN